MSFIGPRNDFISWHDIGGFSCNTAFIPSLFGFISYLVFFTVTGLRFIKFKITSAPTVFFVPEEKFDFNSTTSFFPRLSSRRGIHNFLFKPLSNMNRKFPGFVFFLRLSINRSVSELFSRLLMFCITFLLSPQWWYSKLKCFNIFESVKWNLLILSLRLNSFLIELIACACSHVQSIELTSDSDFSIESISSFDSRTAFNVKFGD